MGVVKLAFLLVLYTAIGAFILMCVPGLPPDVKLEPYEVKPPRKLEGKLAPNAKLDKAEIVFDGTYAGPESITTRGDEVYTGVIGGYILRLKDDKIEKIVRTGKGECAGHWAVEECGRPLGMRFDASGKLIVADATQGLLRVDVDKKTVETLIPRHQKIDGLPLNFADDIDIAKDGSVYLSDAGQYGTFGDILPDTIGEATGRLIKYNPKTKKSETLIDKVRFANGVQLSRKEDFIALCETTLGRVLKYHLTGPKAGTYEVLVDGLPGYPDNIRSNGKGGFYVSLVFARSEENPGLDTFANKTWARKISLRLQYILVKLASLLNKYVPHEITGNLLAYAKHLGPLGDVSAFSKKVIIVEIDENGNILGSLQNKDNKMLYISEIDIGEKYTYLASPFMPQLWRIKTEYL